MLTFSQASQAVSASCDFPGINQYLSRTHTLANRRTWTFSFWAKRDAINALKYVISALANAQGAFIFPSTNTIAYFEFADPSYDLRTSGGSQAVSTWDHFVLAVDTPQATAANRIKIWKNGAVVSFTEFNTLPVQNFQTRIGSGTAHEIGRSVFDETGDFNGRMSEMIMVDGSALTPTAFARFGRPIIPNPVWGSGGFWLRFLDATDLGKDYSGNGNDWTANGNLSQSTDIP